MLAFAAKFMDGKDKDEASARQLIQGLDGIYVRSYEFDKEGQYSMDEVEQLRKYFETSEWSPMVRERERKTGETTDVMVKLVNGEPHGMFILTVEPKELTIVLILGPIRMDELGKLKGIAGLGALGDVTKNANGQGQGKGQGQEGRRPMKRLMVDSHTACVRCSFRSRLCWPAAATAGLTAWCTPLRAATTCMPRAFPSWVLVSLVSRKATHGGVSGMHIAEIRKLLKEPIDGDELNRMVEEKLGAGWQRMIRETSRSGNEQTLIFIHPEGYRMGMFIVDKDGNEMDVVQVSVDPEHLSESIGQYDHGHHGDRQRPATTAN